jgi:DNA-binding IclR family transcriptional regulator
LRALELLSARPLGAAEIGRELDINRSTALRLLSALAETGYVVKDARRKVYSLSKRHVLSLVLGADLPLDWSRRIDPALVQLRDATGDSVVLGIPAGADMAYLAYHPTLHAVGISESVGAVRPMHCSALGKAYLSALSPAELEALLPDVTFVGGTDRAVRDRAALRRQLTEAARDGYATDLEETFADVRCVAAPLRIGRALVGAVGVTGPVSRLPLTRVRELGNQLRHDMARFEAIARA